MVYLPSPPSPPPQGHPGGRFGGAAHTARGPLMAQAAGVDGDFPWFMCFFFGFHRWYPQKWMVYMVYKWNIWQWRSSKVVFLWPIIHETIEWMEGFMEGFGGTKWILNNLAIQDVRAFLADARIETVIVTIFDQCLPCLDIKMSWTTAK